MRPYLLQAIVTAIRTRWLLRQLRPRDAIYAGAFGHQRSNGWHCSIAAHKKLSSGLRARQHSALPASRVVRASRAWRPGRRTLGNGQSLCVSAVFHPWPGLSPKTAFIVAGECRASPALLRSSHEVVSLRLQLTSYRDFVLRPWGSADSHVFLLVACESHPLGDLCDIFAGTRCSQLRLDAPQPVPPKHPKCFERLSFLGRNASRSDETELDGARDVRPDYTGYPIWWRRMADSWDAVREEERRSGQTFGTFLFSRTDLVFIRPMGAWADYVHEPGTPQPWYWHSAGTGTPDIFWIMSRDVALHVLGQSLSVYLECTTTEPCCDLRTWAFSWWIPAYWFRAEGLFPCAPLLGSALLSENLHKSPPRLPMPLDVHPWAPASLGVFGPGSENRSLLVRSCQKAVASTPTLA